MSVNHYTLAAETLMAGSAEGEVLALDEPLSLWGGIDVDTGIICDATHPQAGQSLAQKILIMSSGRGSSSSSSTLLEAVRLNTAPSAIVMQHQDAILAIGALVAADIYHCHIPIVIVKSAEHWQQLRSSQRLQIKAEPGGAQLRGIAS